jgi:hypothetical protein
MKFTFHLDEILEELGKLSCNYLAVQSKTRPNSVLALSKGQMQRVDLDFLLKLLVQLNIEAKNKGLNKTYTIDSIIKFEE